MEGRGECPCQGGQQDVSRRIRSVETVVQADFAPDLGARPSRLIRGNPVHFRQNRSASIYRTIDLRRWCSQIAGLSMILLHVSLFLKDVQWKQRMAYIAQYAGIKETWDGLDTFGKGMPTGCAYYDQSNVPIRMYLDASDRSSGGFRSCEGAISIEIDG